MATGSSLLRAISSRPSLLAAFSSRQLSTSAAKFAGPAYHKGILGYIFFIPFRAASDPDVNHGVYYRKVVNLPRKSIAMTAEAMMTLFWWWILFFCITDWGHVVGDYPWRDPLTYTDKELGIPED